MAAVAAAPRLHLLPQWKMSAGEECLAKHGTDPARVVGGLAEHSAAIVAAAVPAASDSRRLG